MFCVPSAIRRDIGQLLIGSLPGTTITPEIRSLAREFSLGGVILFSRNIEAPEQVAELSHDVQALASELPLWVSVDQEGGRVARLQGAVHRVAADGGARAQRRRRAGVALRRGAGGGAEGGRHHARLRAGARHPHQSEESGDRRSRAGRGRRERSRGWARRSFAGLQDNGVAACGKHFPGHGDTSVDSHLELPLVEHPPDRIRRVECVPFREAIRAGVAFIMTAHVLVPSLDEERPATLSPRIVQAMLRDELGYQGVILSDDLEMKAIAKSYAVPDAAVQAIAAGCDGAADLQRRRRGAGGDARGAGPRGRGGRDSVQAARGCADAPAPREGAVPGRAGRRRAARAACGTCSAATRISASPRRWLAYPVSIASLPAALKPGDRIAIVSPASPFARDEFDAASPSCGVSASCRCTTTPCSHASAGYLAGSGELRAGAFMRHWNDPSVSRADRRARRLRQRPAAAVSRSRRRSSRAPKLFIGYSDNTSILSWLTCQCGITALHGPMLERRLAARRRRLRRALVPGAAAGRRRAGARARWPRWCCGRRGDGPLFGGT